MLASRLRNENRHAAPTLTSPRPIFSLTVTGLTDSDYADGG